MTAAALTEGYRLAFWVGAGLVVVAIAVAVMVLKPERQAKQELQAEAEPAGAEPASSEAAWGPGRRELDTYDTAHYIDST